jgi:alcohol dehydrogenase class IV
MLLPVVTAFSISGAPDRYAACAVAMGVAGPEMSSAYACEALVAALTQLNQDLAVPSPSAFPIDRETYESAIPEMIAQAFASGSPQNNPRIPSVEEMAVLYRAVYAATP